MDEWHDFSNATDFEAVTTAVQGALKEWGLTSSAPSAAGAAPITTSRVMSVLLPTVSFLDYCCKLTLFRRPKPDRTGLELPVLRQTTPVLCRPLPQLCVPPVMFNHGCNGLPR